MRHYDGQAIFEYLEGLSDMGEEIERHAAGCASCAAALEEYREMMDYLANHATWQPTARSPFVQSSYDHFVNQRRDENEAAPALCDEILARPLPWRLQHVRMRVGTRTAGIVQELQSRMRTTLERSPTAALQITSLAVELAETIDAGAYWPGSNTILLAEALRSHGYALSFTGRYRDGLTFADRAQALLEEELKEGRPVPAEYELARLAMVRAACLQYVGRAGEAAQLLRDAAKTFRRYGDREWSVKARISQGTAMYAMGAVEQALEIWRSVEGAPELDELETTRVAHNIALGLCDLGETETAIASAGRCIADFERLGRTTERTRSRTVLGRALLAAERSEEAIPILRQARQEYLELEMVVEAGVSALELAEGLLVTNQAEEVPEICREVIAELTNAGMSQQAAVALGYLQEALALRNVTPLVIRDAGRSLRSCCAEQPRG
jgi:tetratricopeptide (TPR) repeat protein